MTASDEAGQFLPAALTKMTIVKKPCDVVRQDEKSLEIGKIGSTKRHRRTMRCFTRFDKPIAAEPMPVIICATKPVVTC
jgi:hypothetical protein